MTLNGEILINLLFITIKRFGTKGRLSAMQDSLAINFWQNRNVICDKTLKIVVDKQVQMYQH